VGITASSGQDGMKDSPTPEWRTIVDQWSDATDRNCRAMFALFNRFGFFFPGTHPPTDTDRHQCDRFPSLARLLSSTLSSHSLGSSGEGGGRMGGTPTMRLGQGPDAEEDCCRRRRSWRMARPAMSWEDSCCIRETAEIGDEMGAAEG
jgi:hypothetical protein